MPEGQAIHRISRILTDCFAGRPASVTSPQGRFAAGAALLSGRIPGPADAWGKHMFIPWDSAPGTDTTSASRLWLHVHLGLYGTWSLAGPAAPILSGAAIATRHRALVNGSGTTVRARIEGAGVTADLTGPHRCEVLTGPEVSAITDRLGPDPLRHEVGDRERFIAAARRRRVPLGILVMDQAVVAGPGNIYRADCLWRVGISPHRLGARTSQARLGRLWDDLVSAMAADVDSGIICTIPQQYRPSQVPPEDEELARFAVYHRQGRPCVRCGSTIAEATMAGRRLFWCPGCQH